MCGRFTTQYSWAEYYESLNLIPVKAKGRNDPPRYNVTPGQDFGILINGAEGREVIDAKWGLVPLWAKEAKRRPINARSETVASNGMFKVAFKHKRCLIPASSYYEWIEPEPKNSLPYNIHLKNNDPFFFAGIWAYNKVLDMRTCAILTTVPHENIAHIHDRMPVILNDDVCERWMDKQIDVEEAESLIPQNMGEDLVAYRVSKAVNKNSSQGAELIQPIN